MMMMRTGYRSHAPEKETPQREKLPQLALRICSLARSPSFRLRRFPRLSRSHAFVCQSAMGEEEKKPEENKVEEKKAEEEKKPPAEEKKEQKEEAKEKEEKKEEKEEKAEEKEPPPPEEIVLRVFMHCEGCARKVKRCLRGFEGVEEVQTDCKTHKVVVKGKKADPLKVLDRVQRKSHRKVELLTPLPKPPAEESKKPEEEKEKAKPDEKKEEPPVIIVVLKVHMHCEACAQEIRKRILKMKGVQEADPDLKGSQVTVKGVFDASKLVEYVHKRTGKHAFIVKQEPEKKEEEKPKENKEEKTEEGEKEKGGEEAAKAEKKEGGEEVKDNGGGGGGDAEEETKTEAKKHEFVYYYHPRFYTEYQRYPTDYAYPPQIFSDENPNACSVM